MAITRRTLIDSLDGISVRAHRRLIATGYRTVGELLELGGELHGLVDSSTVRELQLVLPAKWRARLLKRPQRKQVTGAAKVQRVRVYCTRCGHVSSVVAHRYAAPCSHCGGKVERRTKGRPRKQPDTV